MCNLKILIIIPARGGSKGIPRKNVRLMNGKPLVSYTIQTAKSGSYSPDIYVSTDSTEIPDVASNYGSRSINGLRLQRTGWWKGTAKGI